MVRKWVRPGSAAGKHSIITRPSLMYQKPMSSNPRFSFYYLHSYVWCIEWCAAFHTTLLPLLNKMSSMSHPEHTVISLSYLIAFIVTWHTYTHTHTHTAGAVLCSVQEWVPAPRVCFNDNKHRFPERSPLVKNKRLQKTFFFFPTFFFFFFHEVTHLALRQADNNF